MDSVTLAAPQALCPGCFAVKGGANPCPHCGYDEGTPRSDYLLTPLTLLHDQYLVGRILGKPGGFGITYLGWDLSLQTRVAIKEYLPREWAGRTAGRATVKPHAGQEGEWFHYGLERFLSEARTLARIDHPNVVRVRTYFAANGTAYLVMDYYQGLTLSEHLERQRGRLPEAAALQLMRPILDGLSAIHAKGFLHRDIKPQNIYLAQTDGGPPRPILLDFGAAREVMDGRTITVVYTACFAPIEQYDAKGKQGPWTDIYSAAAVLYCLVTGQHLPESIARVTGDTLRPAADFGVSKALSDALAAGLAVAAEDRPQTVEAFLARLLSPQPERPPPLERPPRPERSAGSRRSWLAVPASLLTVLLALGGWYQFGPGQRRSGADQNAEQTPPPAVTAPALPMTGQSRIAVSSDARIARDEPTGATPPAAPSEPVDPRAIELSFARLPGQTLSAPVTPPRPQRSGQPPTAGFGASVPPPLSPAASEASLDLSFERKRRVQIALLVLGFDPRATDGTFGAQTRAAIERFQRKQGFAPTGYLAAHQLALLLETAAGPIAKWESEQAEARRRRAAAAQLRKVERPKIPAKQNGETDKPKASVPKSDRVYGGF